MKKKNFYWSLSLLILLISSFDTFGQRDPICGFEATTLEMSTNQRSADCTSPYVVPDGWEDQFCPNQLAGPYVVKIQLHVTINEDGDWSVTQPEFDNVLATLNSNFAGTDITFESNGPICVADDPELDNLDSFSKHQRFRRLCPHENGTINAYISRYYPFAPAALSPWFLPYTEMNMGRNTFLQSSGNTVAHETGHAMGLFHTFNTFGTPTYGCGLPTGADIDRFELVITDYDANATYPEPNCSPSCATDNSYGIDITAGDLVCDTPADPYNQSCSSMLGPFCNYTGKIGEDANGNDIIITDLNGHEYSPDVNNYMSYFPCRTSFTQGQIDRMKYFFLTYYSTVECEDECNDTVEDCHGYDFFFDFCYYSNLGPTCDPCVVEYGNVCIKTNTPWVDSNPNGLPDEVIGVLWERYDPSTDSWVFHHSGICMQYSNTDISTGTKFRATLTVWGQEGTCEICFDFDNICSGGSGYAPDSETTTLLKPSTINIFPNPANDILKMYNPGEHLLLVKLHNIDGRLMKAFDLDAYETKKIAVDQFTNGIYFIKVIDPMSKEVIRTEKVIISH